MDSARGILEQGLPTPETVRSAAAAKSNLGEEIGSEGVSAESTDGGLSDDHVSKVMKLGRIRFARANAIARLLA